MESGDIKDGRSDEEAPSLSVASGASDNKPL